MHPETALITAALAAAIAVIGWVVTSGLAARKDRASQIRLAAINHLERQLENLYGPLAFLIIEGRQEFSDLLQSLGRKYVFPSNGTLPPEELKTWLFWAENRFLPRNDRIKSLLMSNAHLIVTASLPESYRQFLDHANSWKLCHERWQKEGVPYSFHSKINWPKEFEADVLSTFSSLKAEHERLLREQMPRLFGLNSE